VPAPTGTPFGQHALDRRRLLGGLGAVALDEIFALEGHAVLDGDAAAQRPHASMFCGVMVSAWSKNQAGH
jgi:hypothetical protein